MKGGENKLTRTVREIMGNAEYAKWVAMVEAEARGAGESGRVSLPVAGLPDSKTETIAHPHPLIVQTEARRRSGFGKDSLAKI